MDAHQARPADDVRIPWIRTMMCDSALSPGALRMFCCLCAAQRSYCCLQQVVVCKISHRACGFSTSTYAEQAELYHTAGESSGGLDAGSKSGMCHGPFPSALILCPSDASPFVVAGGERLSTDVYATMGNGDDIRGLFQCPSGSARVCVADSLEITLRGCERACCGQPCAFWMRSRNASAGCIVQ